MSARSNAASQSSAASSAVGLARATLPEPGGAAHVKMGRYHILRLLGEGGMGCVYEAYDPELDRKLAIKVLHPGVRTHGDETMVALTRARLIREAKSLAKLAHPNVVPIYDVGIVDDTSIFLAMEFVPGMTLGDWLMKQRPNWQEALGVVLQAGEGLAAAHAAGLLHRDIKPTNIIVGNDGSVRVLDFGLAKENGDGLSGVRTAPGGELNQPLTKTALPVVSRINDNDVTHDGVLCGTLAYLPPEILRGAPFAVNADLFAFGCVLFETLTLTKPFPVESLREREAAIRVSTLLWPPSVPKWLRKIVAQTLAYAPAERGPGLRELLEAIRRGQSRERRNTQVQKGLAFFVLSTVAAAIGLAYVPGGEIENQDCRDPNSLIDTFLSKESLNAARAGFAATRMGIAGELWARAEAGLQAWREKWIDARRNLCPAVQIERGQTVFEGGEREQARACLEEAKNEVATLLAIWAKPSLKQVMESGSVLSSLSNPGECSSVKSLRERRPLPKDPEKRAWFLTQQGKLKGIWMRIDMADYEGAQRELAEMKIPLEGPENLGLLAEWKGAIAALAYRASSWHISSSGALRDAYLWSGSVNEPAPMSELAGRIWFVRVYRGNFLDESEEWLGLQRAALLRASSPARAEGFYERNLAISNLMHGKLRESESHLLRAIASVRRERAANLSDEARLFEDLATIFHYLGDFHRALDVQEQSTAFFVGLFPMGHPLLTWSKLKLADANCSLGQLVDAQTLLANSAKECNDAGVPQAMCLEPYAALPRLESQLGLLHRAAANFSLIVTLENETGRRTDPVDPSAIVDLAANAMRRGDMQSAALAARVALERLEVEGNVPPNAIVETLFASIRIALLRNEIALAQAQLDRVRFILQTPSEESRSWALEFQTLIAQECRLVDSPEVALRESEAALGLTLAGGEPPQSLCPRMLEYSNALLTANHPELAHHYATEAFNLFSTIEGMQPHMRVPYHEVLANIALAQARYGDALSELEQAYLVFDPVEVLDNRLAPLHFIEAKVWWALADSASTRSHAIDLAKQALHEYEDWDGGAATYIHDVKRWLKHHRKHAS
jgi:serine/threonine protein kinase